MSEFPHLSLPVRVDGLYNSPYGPGKRSVGDRKSQATLDNLQNRSEHGQRIKQNANVLIENWINMLDHRPDDSPELPNSIPLFLHVDPKVFSSDDLSSFGIDIVSEKEDGFIIGASNDLELGKLKEKIDKFIENKPKSGKPAQLWEINEGTQWRVDEILSQQIKQRWDSIQDLEILIVEISVACFIKMGEFPTRGNRTDEEFQHAVERWDNRKREKDILRDEIAIKRENDIEEFVNVYSGQIFDIIDFNDSYTFRIGISGKGLKDLVYNYPYLFEVTIPEKLESFDDNLGEGSAEFDVEFAPPDQNSPRVCVIDSGIQENHILLECAVDSATSKSYIPSNLITADQVPGGGHGTRVAGAILYYNNIPRNGVFKPILTLQNARILNESNQLPEELYAPTLMESIVNDYLATETRIFNLSVNENVPSATIHMSSWAAKIDQLILDQNVIFIISTGNINREAISLALQQEKEYPDYLLEDACRIANPAQSSFGVTVGSICEIKYEDIDHESFGQNGEVSSFSRSGLGMWGGIKPDVVEYAGDFIREKIGPDFLISNNRDCSPELVTSTYGGNSPLINRDRVGTSFSTPRVSHVVAAIQANLPEYSTLLYKALLIQSARWPDIYNSYSNKLNVLRNIGYGVPNMDRAIINSNYRITLVFEGNLSPKRADVFNIKIPEEIRRIGDEFDILIEVTVSFRAKPRRTRRYSYSYLSGYLKWDSSQFGELFATFRDRMIQSTEDNTIDSEATILSNLESIPWTIQSRSNSGIRDVKLDYSSTQKDWAFVKSYQLTDDFGIGIVGRPGWEKDLNTEIPYAVVVSFEAINKDIEIYERIRIANEIQITQEVRV